MVNWINTKGDQFLEKHAEIGDSLGHVKTLKEEFDNFENKAKVMEHVILLSIGSQYKICRDPVIVGC